MPEITMPPSQPGPMQRALVLTVMAMTALTTVATMTTLVAQRPAPATRPTSDLKKLSHMIGSWEVTITPTGRPVVHGEATIEFIMDSRGLRERLVETKSKVRALWIHSFNLHHKRFRSVILNSRDGALEMFEGKIADGGFTLTRSLNPQRRVRFTTKKVDKNQFRRVMEITKDAGKTWRKAATALYQRKKTK